MFRIYVDRPGLFTKINWRTPMFLPHGFADCDWRRGYEHWSHKRTFHMPPAAAGASIVGYIFG
jgi:hypothetical protein